MFSHGSDGSKLSLLGSTFSVRAKRTYKRQWNEKKRAGMSFLIVIVFFTVFALIILTEVLMIDDKNKSQSFTGGGLRHAGYNRFGESIPDYEEVKDEYSIEDAVFLRNRFRSKHRGELKLFVFHSTNLSEISSIFINVNIFDQQNQLNVTIRMVFQMPLHGDRFYP